MAAVAAAVKDAVELAVLVRAGLVEGELAVMQMAGLVGREQPTQAAAAVVVLVVVRLALVVLEGPAS